MLAMLSDDTKEAPRAHVTPMSHDDIAYRLRQMGDTYFRVIPYDIIRIIVSMLTYTASTLIKCISSNRLCDATDFGKFLAVDHKHRRYIMYRRKYRKIVKISEQRTEPAVYDDNYYTISADGKNVQRFDMWYPTKFPHYTVNGIRRCNTDDEHRIIQFPHEGGIRISETIEIDYGFGVNSFWACNKYIAECVKYRIDSRYTAYVKIDRTWKEDWIVDDIHHANYIRPYGHSGRTLIVINMITGKRVFQSYGETTEMIAKLQNYWVTLNYEGATATVYSDDSDTKKLASIACAKQGYKNRSSTTKLAVGTDPNTFVVVQDIYLKGGRFRKDRHEKWVSTYCVYEHIVFG